MQENSSNRLTWQQLQLPADLFSSASVILCKTKISDDLIIMLIQNSSGKNSEIKGLFKAFHHSTKHFVLFNTNQREFSKVQCNDIEKISHLSASNPFQMFYQEKELLICAYEKEVTVVKCQFSQDYKTLSTMVLANFQNDAIPSSCTTVLLNKTLLFLCLQPKNGSKTGNSDVLFSSLFPANKTDGQAGSGLDNVETPGQHLALEINADESKITGKWKEYRIDGLLPSARIGYSPTVFNNQLFIFGGRTGDTYCTSVWVLNLNTQTWTKCLNEPPFCISGYAAPSPSGKKIYFFGMKGVKTLTSSLPSWPVSKSLFVYDVTKDAWEDVPSNSEALPIFALPETTNPYLVDRLIVTRDKVFLLHSVKCCFFLSLGNDEDQEAFNYEKDEEPDLLIKQKVLFKQMLFSDVVFSVEGEEISAHKAVLCAGSKFFRNMFTSGMEETTKKVIEVPGIKAHVFKSLIEYVYCSTAAVNYDIVFELFEAADKYSLPGLKRLCEDYLKKNANIENSIDIVNFAEKYEADGLRDAVLRYIAKNFEKVFDKERPVQLKASTLLEIYRKK